MSIVKVDFQQGALAVGRRYAPKTKRCVTAQNAKRTLRPETSCTTGDVATPNSPFALRHSTFHSLAVHSFLSLSIMISTSLHVK